MRDANTAKTPLEKSPEKISGSERDSNPRPLRYRCNALPTELSEPHESGYTLRLISKSVDIVHFITVQVAR